VTHEPYDGIGRSGGEKEVDIPYASGKFVAPMGRKLADEFAHDRSKVGGRTQIDKLQRHREGCLLCDCSAVPQDEVAELPAKVLLTPE